MVRLSIGDGGDGKQAKLKSQFVRVEKIFSLRIRQDKLIQMTH
jgi:hypothetical protein